MRFGWFWVRFGVYFELALLAGWLAGAHSGEVWVDWGEVGVDSSEVWGRLG